MSSPPYDLLSLPFLILILVAYAILTALGFVLSPRTLHSVNVFLLRLTVSCDLFGPLLSRGWHVPYACNFAG